MLKPPTPLTLGQKSLDPKTWPALTAASSAALGPNVLRLLRGGYFRRFLRVLEGAGDLVSR